MIKQRGNTTIPAYLVNAWEHICPYCHRPPTVEHLSGRYQLKCPDAECPVMPSALPAETLAEACVDWSARVELVEAGALLTLNGEPMQLDEETAQALSDAFYGMRVPPRK